MQQDFSRFLIKKYKYWSVYIYKNQTYLGRCYIWCNRENAHDLVEITEEERKELFIVLVDLKKSLTDLFSPDLFNYAFLGNKTRHLHGHIIPRYKKPRKFKGITFEDNSWGERYDSDDSFNISKEVLFKIKGKIRESLKQKN